MIYIKYYLLYWMQTHWKDLFLKIRMLKSTNKMAFCSGHNLYIGIFPLLMISTIWRVSSPTAIHSPPLVNGVGHLTTMSSSTANPPVSSDSVLPRPFRLESLGIPLSNSKVRRKKSKTHIQNEGIWKDWEFLSPTYSNTSHYHLYLTEKILYHVIIHSI